jgi:hypothetical protein
VEKRKGYDAISDRLFKKPSKKISIIMIVKNELKNCDKKNLNY